MQKENDEKRYIYVGEVVLSGGGALIRQQQAVEKATRAKAKCKARRLAPWLRGHPYTREFH